MAPYDEFHGVKVALLHGERLLVYLRDDKPSIPYPDHWDLPGGGREGDEDPVACARREIDEEFGLTLSADAFAHVRRYEGRRGGPGSYFLVGAIGADHVASIRFGDEGQRWTLMTIADFLSHEKAVPDLQARASECLAALAGALVSD